MDMQSPESIDGRLIAQRKAMALIVAAMDGAAREALEAALSDRSVFSGGDEDPGSDGPSGAFAVEAAAAEEYRLILEDAKRFRAGGEP